MILDTGKLNMMLGGQLGSEGKGDLASYIGAMNHIDITISNASSNAGHTFYYHGRKCVVKHLPVSGIINDRSTIYLCAGAIISVKTLLDEMDRYGVDPDRVSIHPRAAIITDDDVAHERDNSSSVAKIASTQSGVGAALVNKIKRSAKLAGSTPELASMVRELDIHQYLNEGCTVFMEVPQGFDLSLNGPFYPYCTSRDVTVSSAMNDANVHPSYLGKVAVCLRTFPIRVGNIVVDGKEIGFSGPFYDDSVETSWEAIGVEAELTTVTKRVRRVATFSMKQYRRMLSILRPDYILLNFANYMSRADLAELLEKCPEITHLGFSEHYKDIVLNNGYFMGD